MTVAARSGRTLERMYVLRWDRRLKNVYGDIYVEGGRRVNSLVV
jgi:hypothetical protein